MKTFGWLTFCLGVLHLIAFAIVILTEESPELTGFFVGKMILMSLVTWWGWRLAHPKKKYIQRQKYCTNCGSPSEANKFCTNCGLQVGKILR